MCPDWFKGTVSLFWPRGPEIALTFLRNEFIVKLQNSQMGPSYGRNEKNFRLLFKWPGFFVKMTRFLVKMTRFLVKMTRFLVKMTRFLLKMTPRLLCTSKKWQLLLFKVTRFLLKMTRFLVRMTRFLVKMTRFLVKMTIIEKKVQVTLKETGSF